MGFKIETNNNNIISQYNSLKSDLDYDKSKFNNIVVDEKNLDSNYQIIRKLLLEKFNSLRLQNIENYQFDLQLGLELYSILNSQPDFTPIYESSYDFWKYMAVYVIPDIIEYRFGYGTENKYTFHYYKKTVRIYPYTLYWYINLSWQGSIEKTYDILKNNSTDEILQLVERPSKVGINLELYREIVKRFSLIPKENRFVMLNGVKKKLFRYVLIKNTSKLIAIRPEIYPGGIHGYVDMLFESKDRRIL